MLNIRNYAKALATENVVSDAIGTTRWVKYGNLYAIFPEKSFVANVRPDGDSWECGLAIKGLDNIIKKTFPTLDAAQKWAEKQYKDWKRGKGFTA